jgi:hypothetical protein
MRYRYAAPYGRRAETLALQKRIEDLPLVETGEMSCTTCQIAERLLLVLHPQGGENAFRLEEIAQIHSLWPFRRRRELGVIRCGAVTAIVPRRQFKRRKFLIYKR